MKIVELSNVTFTMTRDNSLIENKIKIVRYYRPIDDSLLIGVYKRLKVSDLCCLCFSDDKDRMKQSWHKTYSVFFPKFVAYSHH